jgi:Ser/Thr protein kinase RdoA (MazF antagonist)
VNNVVQYVQCGEKRLVLRVYNNGENAARVAFEHAVLNELRKHPLSFAIPTTLPALDGGASHVPLRNGAEASMFELIPGTLPKLTHVRPIGRATGELTTAMYKISLPLESPTVRECGRLALCGSMLAYLLRAYVQAPYYDIYKVHHAVTRDTFYATVAGAAFNGVRDATNYLVEELRSVESTIEECHAMQLPASLIHGDLHYDNVLVDQGKVSGLLDFEFCAKDWRAMEIAICLSKYVGEPEPMGYLTEFIEGYAEHGVLTAAEIKAVPALINLRVLSNVVRAHRCRFRETPAAHAHDARASQVYFVGRALAGEDDIRSLTTRAEAYAARVRWVNANGSLISDLLTKAILAPAGSR